jgi:Zn-dependent protease with chaperone function
MSGFRSSSFGLGAGLLAALCSFGCAHETAAQPVYTWGPANGQPANGTPGVASPGATPGATTPGAVATIAPTLTPVSPNDPINNHELTFLRGRAQAILNELVAALPPPQQARVNGIPLVVDSTPGEVNAFASCSGSSPAMAITDGLLQIQSQLARFRAYDELAGSNKVGEYIGIISQQAQPKRPIPEVPAGFADPRFDLDARKVTRQYQVLDEQLAFVMGHELGHHYLGHLPCTALSPLSLGQLSGVLANAVPAFNQPNEVAADMVGVNNTLTMGSRRADYHLTEGGALLTMQFFAGLDQLKPSDILFGFERDHPPPQLRTPIIQQTAATWRATGGVGLPIFSL